MLATPGTLPIGENWTFQAKLDGIRLIASLNKGRLRLTSRNEKDLTSGFPEFRSLRDALLESGVDKIALDGELVGAATSGAPHLGDIASRIHRKNATAADVKAHPVTYVIFDILHLNTLNVMDRPYVARQEMLGQNMPTGPGWTIAANFDDGPSLWEATLAQGLEGVVSKRDTSTYQPGTRSPNWIKSVHRAITDVVIYGWRYEEGRRGKRIGSLMVGIPDLDGLRPVGRVGSGMTQDLSDALGPVFESIAQEQPAAPPSEDSGRYFWVEPILVVEVRHLGFTSDGSLRHPAILRVRSDITADDLEVS